MSEGRKRSDTLKKKTKLGNKEVYMDKEQWVDKAKKRNVEFNDEDMLNEIIGSRSK